MTNEQAIRHLEDLQRLYLGNEKFTADIEAIGIAIKALKQESDTWSLEGAREDFVDDVYNTLDFLPTNDEANQIIDSFDRVTSSIRREPCEDCISREDAINKIEEWANGFEEGGYFSGKSVADAIRACGGIIDELPPVRPNGKWIFKDDNIAIPTGYYQCSKCEEGKLLVKDNYCPNCGAKMLQEDS